MSQSTLIVGLLAAGFLIYLAANNRLGVYTNVLWGPAPAASGAGGSGAGSGLSGGTGSAIANQGTSVLGGLVKGGISGVVGKVSSFLGVG